MTPQLEIFNNQGKSRFEVTINDEIAISEYILRDTKIIFTHTEVPPKLEGQGIASQLAKAGLEFARTEGLKVMPLCPYIAGYLRRHTEYQDLVLSGFRY